jgi:2-polyprenyl-3-methyl-5-hydroxy-6-metoxy-1,4-benzoquinol methylase
MTVSRRMESEARAFDARIKERVQHGMVPDLQNARPCEWFYNNPWRHPVFVDMIFGEYLRFALRHLPAPRADCLEVGSGPGHMSLQLARHGYDVAGLEISAASIEVAEETLKASPPPETFGSLRYIHSDFLAWQPEQQFDAVCFFLTLHHFDEPRAVLTKAASLLRPNGIVIVIEPARDWFSIRDAAIVALTRVLLSLEGRWYERIETPQSSTALDELIHEIHREYIEARDTREPAQSPFDNSSYASSMITELESIFSRIALQHSYAFLPRVVGGIRSPSEKVTLETARFLQLFDAYCVQHDLLEPAAFCYAGIYRNQKR